WTKSSGTWRRLWQGEPPGDNLGPRHILAAFVLARHHAPHLSLPLPPLLHDGVVDPAHRVPVPGVLDRHPRLGLVVLDLDALELVAVVAETLVDGVLLVQETPARRRRNVVGRHLVLAPADAFLEGPHVGEEVLGAVHPAAAGDEPEKGQPA